VEDEERERELDLIHRMLNDPAKKKRPKQIWTTAVSPEGLKKVEKIKEKEAEKREREGKARKADH
jgi:hypothetical protein